MVIMMLGYVFRRGHYLVEDLQVFNEGRRGGAYWFRSGINWRAMTAWLLAAVAALLFANTPLLVGPLGNLAAGIDISLPVALLTAAIAYPAALFLFPEPRSVFGPQGPRLVPAREETEPAPAPSTEDAPTTAAH